MYRRSTSPFFFSLLLTAIQRLSPFDRLIVGSPLGRWLALGCGGTWNRTYILLSYTGSLYWAYWQYYAPKFAFSTPALALTKKQYDRIQAPVVSTYFQSFTWIGKQQALLFLAQLSTLDWVFHHFTLMKVQLIPMKFPLTSDFTDSNRKEMFR